MKTSHSIGLLLYDNENQALSHEGLAVDDHGNIPVLNLRNDTCIPKQAPHITATTPQRQYRAVNLLKTVTCISPILYAAYCARQSFNKAELCHYHCNEQGQEQEYYRIVLNNVTVMTAKNSDGSAVNQAGVQHFSLSFSDIQWRYIYP